MYEFVIYKLDFIFLLYMYKINFRWIKKLIIFLKKNIGEVF